MLISLKGQKSEKSLGTEDLIKKKLHYFNDYISFKTSLYNKYRIVHFSVIVNFFYLHFPAAFWNLNCMALPSQQENLGLIY